jgi:hypothetical protein
MSLDEHDAVLALVLRTGMGGLAAGGSTGVEIRGQRLCR